MTTVLTLAARSGSYPKPGQVPVEFGSVQPAKGGSLKSGVPL